MQVKYILAFLLVIHVSYCFSQALNKHTKNGRRANIEIITFDGLNIKGRVADITLDYILLDAARFNTPVTLSAYYIRPEGAFYKIGVEYIKLATVKVKKKVAQSAAGRAVTGAIVAGNAVADNNVTSAGEFFGASAAGAGIGVIAGTVSGLFRHSKRVLILGNSFNLMELVKYYEYVNNN